MLAGAAEQAACPWRASSGFAQRCIHGPVMLCQIGGTVAGEMTIRQLVELLTWPLTVPSPAGGEPAAAAAGLGAR